jgi:hypothetical protein
VEVNRERQVHELVRGGSDDLAQERAGLQGLFRDGIRGFLSDDDDVAVGDDASVCIHHHGVSQRPGTADQRQIAGEEELAFVGQGFPRDLREHLDHLDLALLHPLDKIPALRHVNRDAAG